MKNHTSENILKGISENDRVVIQYVYDKYYNGLKVFVLSHGGDEEDAKDLFQDGIVIIYEQVRQKNLVLQNQFISYFYSICKYQWMNLLRERNKMNYKFLEAEFEYEKQAWNENKLEIDEIIEKERRSKLYQLNFLKLSNECQKLLKKVTEGLNVDEITRAMNYKTKNFTYKKRRICKERLIKLIKNED